MAATPITVTTDIPQLKTVFNKLKYAYYTKSAIETTDVQGGFNADLNLPVLQDGVTFDTGTVDVSEIKLTDEQIWTTRSTRGDADVSFQIASIAGAINETFMNKLTSSDVNVTSNSFTYKGNLYSLDPKKVTGGLILLSEDYNTVVVITSIEAYANLVLSDGDNPAYFNMAVKPTKNAAGGEIMIFEKAA